MQAQQLTKLDNKLMCFMQHNNCLLQCYVNKDFKNQFLDSLYHCVILAKYCRGLVESAVVVSHAILIWRQLVEEYKCLGYFWLRIDKKTAKILEHKAAKTSSPLIYFSLDFSYRNVEKKPVRLINHKSVCSFNQ